MSDLISRQDAINCCSCLHPEECWDEIRKIPSAVEVVRCKDCKHRDPEDKKCDCGMWHFPYITDDNDYCSYGERREP